MCGHVDLQSSLFSYFSTEEWIPAEHPLRRIKAQADSVLASMNASFEALYAEGGRPSIAPERLLIEAWASFKSVCARTANRRAPGAAAPAWSTSGVSAEPMPPMNPRRTPRRSSCARATANRRNSRMGPTPSWRTGTACSSTTRSPIPGSPNREPPCPSSIVGADKGYHTQAFVVRLRQRYIAPHVAQIEGRRPPGLDARTTRHAGYAVSQRKRKRITIL